MLARIGGEGALRDALLGAVISVLALIVSCFAVAVVGHAGSDECAGRTEQVLATATSRSRVFVATAIVALAGATWLLLVAGVALTLGTGNGPDHSVVRLIASALAQAPAMWVVVTLALLCFAVRSGWAPFGWLLIVVFAVLGQIGELLDLPSWVLDLSPYRHAPRMPLAGFDLVPAVVLTMIAAAVLTGSWMRYRTRDIG